MVIELRVKSPSGSDNPYTEGGEIIMAKYLAAAIQRFLILHLQLHENAVTFSLHPPALSNAMIRSAKSVISENWYARLSPGAMAAAHPNGSIHRDFSRMARTITSLKRWSITSRELPGWNSCPHVLMVGC